MPSKRALEDEGARTVHVLNLEESCCSSKLLRCRDRDRAALAQDVQFDSKGGIVQRSHGHLVHVPVVHEKSRRPPDAWDLLSEVADHFTCVACSSEPRLQDLRVR